MYFSRHSALSHIAVGSVDLTADAPFYPYYSPSTGSSPSLLSASSFSAPSSKVSDFSPFSLSPPSELSGFSPSFLSPSSFALSF